MPIITISRGTFSGGKELAECLARSLGYACISREVLKGGAIDFIPKPFKMSQLREMALRLAAEKAAKAQAEREP
jgi:FixJ family two-component response regulator